MGGYGPEPFGSMRTKYWIAKIQPQGAFGRSRTFTCNRSFITKSRCASLRSAPGSGSPNPFRRAISPQPRTLFVCISFPLRGAQWELSRHPRMSHEPPIRARPSRSGLEEYPPPPHASKMRQLSGTCVTAILRKSSPTHVSRQHNGSTGNNCERQDDRARCRPAAEWPSMPPR